MLTLRLCLLLFCLTTALFSYRHSVQSRPSEAAAPALVASGSKLGAPVASAYQHPVLERDFPDPGVLEAGGVFYSFATNSNGSHIPVARSNDLVRWTLLPDDALPTLAPWVKRARGMIWAPEVIKIGSGYRMYYVAPDLDSGRQCIGVAISDLPQGPYRDNASQPLICPAGFERAIDPNPFEDGGRLYVYFSGVCCGSPNGIYAQRLSDDGLSTVGAPSLVLRVGAPWEGTVAEAPTMLKHDGRYYLFYSGNDYRDHTYAVGYAVCKGVLGPCLKSRDNPVVATSKKTGEAIGPGHQAILKVGEVYWMLFHGWHRVSGYDQGGRRVLWLRPISWQDGQTVDRYGPREPQLASAEAPNCLSASPGRATWV